MPGSIGFFSRFANVGAKILRTASGSSATPLNVNYLNLLSQIYEVLAQIHKGVLEVVIAVGQSRTIAEAKTSLDALNQLSIRNALHVQAMCDELERLGHELKSLMDGGGVPLTDEEKQTWENLCRELKERESGTASLYYEKLYDLRVLPDTEPSIEAVQAKAEVIASEIVNQKAEFEFLAMKAKGILNKRL
jgi:hypothetical protein